VIERSFALTVPGSAVELLLADNSHAHLYRMVAASPTGTCPGVRSTRRPMSRRPPGQVQYFSDIEALDACPSCEAGRLPDQALCGPVSIMGRTVGVIHATRTTVAPSLKRS